MKHSSSSSPHTLFSIYQTTEWVIPVPRRLVVSSSHPAMIGIAANPEISQSHILNSLHPQFFLRVGTKLFPSFKFMQISVKNLKGWSLWGHPSFNSKVNNLFKSTLFPTLHGYALNATDLTGSIFMATKSNNIFKLFPFCTEWLLLSLLYFVHSACSIRNFICSFS